MKGNKWIYFFMIVALSGVMHSWADYTCTRVRVVSQVCVQGAADPEPTCTTQVHYDLYCTVYNTGGAVPSCLIGKEEACYPGDGPGGFSPYDSNRDGIADDWQSIVDTDDPCSQNFNQNDRLGTNYGGTNSTRPNHSGVDIQCDEGDSVRAWRSGTVTRTNTSGIGCGNEIEISHNDGSRSIYCHLQNIQVLVNDVVDAGYLLGTADSTGNSTGHHLHISYIDSNNIRREYFSSTDTVPAPSELSSGGC
jgi:hypothetical protein